MKIGITCYPTYGGSGVVATELGKKLAQIGHEVHFISYALPYRLNVFHSNLFFHEVKVTEYPLFEYPPYSLSLAVKMAEVVEHARLDILHVHYAIPHATSAILAREMLQNQNLKFVTTLHGTDITLIGSDPNFARIVEYSIDQSNGATAVSRHLKETTEQIFKIKKPIEVIHNFIPDSLLQRPLRKELTNCFKPHGEFVMAHISNFRPVKRTIDLVEVVEYLVKDGVNIKLLMVGDGPDRGKVENKCRETGLCDHILFLGKQDNISEILSGTDIFMMPSETESFGLAVLEAMACGVPCITTNAGGLPEVNIDGETGFTENVGDTRAFANRVAELAGDAKLLKKFSKQAKDYALGHFKSDLIIPQYVSFYEKILSS